MLSIQQSLLLEGFQAQYIPILSTSAQRHNLTMVVFTGGTGTDVNYVHAL